MGIAAALVLLLAAGTLFNAMLVQARSRAGSGSWTHPVVKTIYGATRDFVKLLPTGGKRRTCGASCSPASARRR
jgi:hypothetical protein